MLISGSTQIKHESPLNKIQVAPEVHSFSTRVWVSINYCLYTSYFIKIWHINSINFQIVFVNCICLKLSSQNNRAECILHICKAIEICRNSSVTYCNQCAVFLRFIIKKTRLPTVRFAVATSSRVFDKLSKVNPI